MLTKEQEYICADVSIHLVERNGNKPQRDIDRRNEDAGASGLFEFAGNAPVTFADRFPHLTVCAVTASVILTAITAEIECLRAMGYSWP